MSQEDEHWMKLAISVAQGNPSAPFGAIIVDTDSGQERARGVNRSRDDPTLHGEMAAIRAAFALGARPRSVSLALYTTAEPCPMCAAACFWAGIQRIVYGVSIPWLSDHGWRQIALRAADVLAAAKTAVEVEGGVLEDECARLFRAAR